MAEKLSIDELATFCKRKGFVFRSSEIYGGFSGFWDFGPLGIELFTNIKKDFWRFFVHQREDIVGMDGSIISHPRTWKASGHLASFKDIAVVCKKCKRATKIDSSRIGESKCENCGGEYKEQGEFNLMFKTSVGAVNSSEVYLRGETAQGMFMNFRLVHETSRLQLPFGIAQVGKCFRNEIAPRDFLFRSREFTIGEIEFFIHPDEKKCPILESRHLNFKVSLLDAEAQERKKEELKIVTVKEMIKEKKLDEWHAYWLAEQLLWLARIGLGENIKVREHLKSELSHYSSATFDLDFTFPFGSKEIAGNSDRGQYDLMQHSKESGENFSIFDEGTKKRVVPRVIEPTFGMERVFLALICSGYKYDNKRENVVLGLPAFLAPASAAVFPLVKDPKMSKMAKEVYHDLSKEFYSVYDESGSVGRRYARNDEIGTPFCITVDSDSLKNNTVTIRDRNTMQQIRVSSKELRDVIRKLVSGEADFLKIGKKVR